jgi:hypothetical protein
MHIDRPGRSGRAVQRQQIDAPRSGCRALRREQVAPIASEGPGGPIQPCHLARIDRLHRRPEASTRTGPNLDDDERWPGNWVQGHDVQLILPDTHVACGDRPALPQQMRGRGLLGSSTDDAPWSGWWSVVVPHGAHAAGPDFTLAYSRSVRPSLPSSSDASRSNANWSPSRMARMRWYVRRWCGLTPSSRSPATWSRVA